MIVALLIAAAILSIICLYFLSGLSTLLWLWISSLCSFEETYPFMIIYSIAAIISGWAALTIIPIDINLKMP